MIRYGLCLVAGVCLTGNVWSEILDESWIVSVYGRSIAVNPDGGFWIPNVSLLDEFGRSQQENFDGRSDDFIRLTGFSLAENRPRFVKSRFFQLENLGDGVDLGVEDFEFSVGAIGTPEFIRLGRSGDVDLRVAGGEIVLREVGETIQLKTVAFMGDETASFLDNPGVDVTPRSEFTTYRSSNPAIAFVNENGLVTARSRGTAFITAVHDLISASKRVVVDVEEITTITGRLVDTRGRPIIGAAVSIDGTDIVALSESGGTFRIENVSISRGEIIRVTASFGGVSRSRSAVSLAPGITDVGRIFFPGSSDVGGPDASFGPGTIDLSNWQYQEYSGIAESKDLIPPVWELGDGGFSVTQIQDDSVSIFTNGVDLGRYSIRGSWRVDGRTDNDLFGLVFCYQDRDHYYLFDWKSEAEEISLGDFLFHAEGGMSIKRIDRVFSLIELWDPESSNVTDVLTRNQVPWEYGETYDFFLDVYPPLFSIVVMRGSEILSDLTVEDDVYSGGAFGFYNFSQPGVRYRGGFDEDSPIVVSVSPRGTFLPTFGQNVDLPTVIDLAEHGLVPGDVLLLKAVGAYLDGPSDRARRSQVMTAIFSSSNELLDESVWERVPGALDAEKSWMLVTPAGGDLFAGDFLVTSELQSSEQIRVPEGARFLFVGTYDGDYSDNETSESEFRVFIKQID